MGDGDLKKELEKIGSAYVDCFNRRDAKGIAALYARGGIHVNAAGPRPDIEQLYLSIFGAGFDHQEATVDEAWSLGGDTALAIGQYRVAGKDQTGARIERGGYWTATYVRQGQGWKIMMQTALPK